MVSSIIMIVLIGSLSITTIALVKWVLSLRRVVATNEVHIVQSSKKTTSYGKDTADNAGNTYYEWPSWIPVIGVQKIVLPVSVFDLDLREYDAYDKERLPFIVDVKAFFRISNSNMAASRVESFNELHAQLTGIVQGAVRSIMANAQLEAIMSERSIYGQKFTEEVEEQLKSWGVTPVKNIELMDIRDARDSRVIHNIMEKKKSHIEMESRTEVAKNQQIAQEAEIAAQQQVDLRAQEARQTVGLREALVTQEVGIANEQAQQEIKEQSRITTEKEMSIIKVQQVKQAEITKEANVVKAEEEKQVVVLKAEGDLEAKKKEAEGIKVEGQASAEAEKLMQLAPVEAQIVLAKEIGENQGYQNYLVTIRQVEATQAVGIEQARNLGNADIKVIANTGDVHSGVSNVMELFTSKGGTSIGAGLEALANTEIGAQLLGKLTKPKSE